MSIPPDTPQYALPGQGLGSNTKFSPGPGTHAQDEDIFASLLGLVGSSKGSSSSSSNKAPRVLSVNRPAAPFTRSIPLLPSVGSQVYARITRLGRQQAICSILVICPISSSDGEKQQKQARPRSQPQPHQDEAVVATQPFRGILRSQDVRATEKDKVKLLESFRVGDIIRAVVISLGDQGGYFVSTAGNEFGVVMAWSEAGNGCVPISWCEVRDEITGEKESRKVARPF